MQRNEALLFEKGRQSVLSWRLRHTSLHSFEGQSAAYYPESSARGLPHCLKRENYRLEIAKVTVGNHRIIKQKQGKHLEVSDWPLVRIKCAGQNNFYAVIQFAKKECESSYDTNSSKRKSG